MPAQRTYQKKTELGWQMIQWAQAAGIPFAAVTFDSVYGQDSEMRDQCRAAGLEYYADVKSTTQVYLRDPSAAFVANAKGGMPHQPQTPVMALDLTGHIWSLCDLLLTPVFSLGGAR